MICSICVCTYKRPELLRDLLDSLMLQELPSGTKLEIIVVDNDCQASAEPVVKGYADSQRACIQYHVEPIKNISLARNRAVKHATGDYVLFIDDDEVASPEWAALLLKTVMAYDADVVVGSVWPKFADNTPKWLQKSTFFEKKCPATGSQIRVARTSNCIVRRSLLESVPGPFAPMYGITGGEDSHLFRTLLKRGAKFISCREASVTEFIPPNRARVPWLIRRAFRAGNTYSRSVIELAEDNKRKLLIRVKLCVKALILGLVSFGLMLFNLPFKIYCIHWMMKLSGNLGHILAAWGHYYKEYAGESP